MRHYTVASSEVILEGVSQQFEMVCQLYDPTVDNIPTALGFSGVGYPITNQK